jgi:hypothetical protein
MNIMELGALGEFVGSIAVVVTLIFLAIQVRHSKNATEANTQSVDESRKVAKVQTYHARAAEAAAHYRMLAEYDHIPIMLKRTESGVDSLTDEERLRLFFLDMSTAQRMDSTYYAFQQGLLDAEHYESGFIPAIRNMAPQWRSVGLPPMRDSFNAEVERILALDPTQIKNYNEGSRAFHRR